MSHSCEKDQCASCLWKPYHSCLTNKTQLECEAAKEHQWCGGSSAQNMRANLPKKTIRTKKESRASKRATRVAPSATASACGSCSGCQWTTGGQTYCFNTWSQAVCDRYGPSQGYVWCGGNVPVTSVNCCDKTNGICNTVSGSSCPVGQTKVSDCSPGSCSPAVQCANPYYTGGGPNSSCNLNTLLPNNPMGVSRWLKLFPALDPSSPQFATEQCDQLNSVRNQAWNAGCLMFGQGGNNGLSAFLQVAAQFPGFASGPDARRNILELAAFFGNVMQETGDPPNGGLVYSAELLTPCSSTLLGKGPLQLTAATNYQMATLGLNKPSDLNQNISSQYTLQGACLLNGEYPPADDCWAQCAAATPTPPPHGAGYNYCARPWLASGLNDMGPTPKLDPLPAWASALWYWMNVPIQASASQGFYKMQGDVSCATAHNLIQDPMYDCGDWCAITSIAQVGCPSCCIAPTTVPNMQTVNRIGNIVKVAGILGLPEAQGDAANSLFCKLITTCMSGPGAESVTCPAGLSYQCYLNGTCSGGGGGTVARCGNKPHAMPAPACVAIPGNNVGATDTSCAPCQTGQTWWPCPTPGACQWASQ